MTDLLDGVRMGSFDTEYDDDTIEMVLSESAMHLLSQAAAHSGLVSPAISSAVNEAEAQPVAAGHGAVRVPAIAEAGVVAKVQPIAEARGVAKAYPVTEIRATPKAQVVVETQTTPEARAAADARVTPKDQSVAELQDGAKAQPVTKVHAAPEAQPAVGAPTTPAATDAVAKQKTVTKDPTPPQGYRPAMSTLRFALILTLVAVGSALLTAGTYFFTTGGPPPEKIVTIRVPVAAAPGIAAPPSAPAVTTATAEALPTGAAPAGASAKALTPASAVSSAPAGASATALTPATAVDAAPLTGEPATVRFVNPFDKKEVFEFPPGTSQADARDAVAQLLAERARDRRGQLVKTPRRTGKTAERSEPSVAPRS